MATPPPKNKGPGKSGLIAENKKAAFDYFFEERHECGMVLEGWEVKAVREGKVQLTDGYVVIRNKEMYIISKNCFVSRKTIFCCLYAYFYICCFHSKLRSILSFLHLFNYYYLYRTFLLFYIKNTS